MCWTCLPAAAHWRWKRSAGARRGPCWWINPGLAVQCIRRNVETLGFSQRAVIFQGDWKSAAAKLPQEPFDLVFLDPPYRLEQYGEMAAHLKTCRLLAKDALIVIEHRKGAAMDLPADFTCKDFRTYGDTVIHFYLFNTGGTINGHQSMCLPGEL